MTKKIRKIVQITFFCIISIITIGYAIIGGGLGLNGSVSLGKTGKVEITNIIVDTSKEDKLSKYGSLIIGTNDNIELNYNFPAMNTSTFSTTYLIDITNNSFMDYTYTGISINPVINVESSDDGGANISYTLNEKDIKNTIKKGETIKSNETKTISVTITIKVGSRNGVDVTGGGSIIADVENKGDLTVTISSGTLDLRGTNQIKCFTINTMNTYGYQRTYSLTTTNTNFTLVNSNETPIDLFTIDKPDETNPNANIKQEQVCIKKTNGSIFTSQTSTTTIEVDSAGIDTFSAGNLTLLVDITEEEDTKIPEIGNINFTVDKYDTTSNKLISTITWNRLDIGGTNIVSYYVVLYDATTNQKIKEFKTNSDSRTYKMELEKTFLDSNINPSKNYYVKVYGEDAAGNIGNNYCSSNNNNYCVKSNNKNLKWSFTVTNNLTNMSSNGATTVYLNNTYNATLTSQNTNYNLPDNLQITMNGETLTLNTDYTYSLNAGSTNKATLNITKKIDGNITITGRASYSGGVCLVEGTKIKLANGTYKNIEDIKYDDLIQAYSYDLGRIVYEYPIWIEKEGTTNEYQKTTFSDGTILETVGPHGVYSKDINKYISVQDRKNFHKGTNIVKIDENNKVKIIQVSKIEIINKKVHYYHVASTRYHNAIANDLLTTDAMLIVSNMFDFDNNIMWTKERDEFLSKNDLYNYNDWIDYFPNHIFKGFRMEEAKKLYYDGLLDINLFSILLVGLEKKPIKDNEGNNLWMITTSDEYVQKGKGKLYKELSCYTLPKPIQRENKTFKGWYNTADNKIYNIGDKVIIDYGMFFEAIWE